MGTVDRLRRITGEDKQDVRKESRREEIGSLRRRIEDIMARRPQAKSGPGKQGAPLGDLNDLIAGEEMVTETGSFFLATQKRESRQPHGNRAVGDLAGLDMQAAALLAGNPGIARCLISEGLFLDTETTGLSGGTGTLAFMIGMGCFEGDAFVTRQIFIRDFSEELPALRYLADVLRTKKFLVSFNGKAFDANLLGARCILNRCINPLDDLPHLDLLFPARRLCGHRLENSRLTTLERELFGFYRDDDIPGGEIPGRYFSWLNRRDPNLVAGIFKHNHLDILSLALLTVHLSELLCPRSSGHSAGPSAADPRDLLAAARLLYDRNKDAQAGGLLRDLAAGDHVSVRAESQRMLSLALKRKGEWENAALLWEAMLRENPENLFAAVELAKWHEHKCRNFRAACDLVSRTLERAPNVRGDEREALEHRLRRLQSRLSREKD
jgi:uncharacterized protein